TGRSGLTGAAVGGCFYTFGGEGNAADPNGIFHNVEVYDPATDEWTELPPMQTGRHGIYAGVLGNVIYIPGGAVLEGLGVTGVNEAYVIGTVETREPVVLSSSPRAAPGVVGRGGGRRRRSLNEEGAPSSSSVDAASGSRGPISAIPWSDTSRHRRRRPRRRG